MSEANFTVISWILCDDIRTEMSGKQSAYGLYDGEMIVAAVPAVVAKLCLRVSLVIRKPRPKKVKVSIASGANRFFEFDGDIAKPMSGSSPNRFTFVFVASPGVLPAEGTYLIKLGVDGPLKKIGEIIVRTPNSDFEKQRLAASQM